MKSKSGTYGIFNGRCCKTCPLLSLTPQMRFDQDNTISDRPMVDVVTSLDHMLSGAAARAGASAAGAALHQLVLIIADGRYAHTCAGGLLAVV
jgi:hypothetical protein